MASIASVPSRIDYGSLALHSLVAAKVQAAPNLLNKAKETWRRWRNINGSNSPALAEWAEILCTPATQIAALLKERSERATGLRQSSSFAGILSDAERDAIYESYSARKYNRAASRIQNDADSILVDIDSKYSCGDLTVPGQVNC